MEIAISKEWRIRKEKEEQAKRIYHSNLIAIGTQFNKGLNKLIRLLYHEFGDIWIPVKLGLVNSVLEVDSEKNICFSDELLSYLFFLVEKDTTENQHTAYPDKLKVYCCISTRKGLIVLRDVFFYMDSVLLIPFFRKYKPRRGYFYDEILAKCGMFCWNDDDDLNSNEPYYPEYNTMLQKSLNLIGHESFLFCIKHQPARYLYCFKHYKVYEKNICDDYGKKFSDYAEDSKLSGKKIDCIFLNQDISLDVSHRFAPYTSFQDEVHCVLYAKTERVSGNKNVRVLRWFPAKTLKAEKHYNCLSELGYVNQNNSAALYDEMISTNNHILFGIIRNQNIHILGNLNAFVKGGPLSSYVLPRQLYEFID